VNRAYYAMFYAVLALLQRIGRVPSRHAGVISLFDTEFVLKAAIPAEPPSPMITRRAALAFRKLRCDNTP
jgi:uncharacterized protein (UPF0332 family)